MADEETKKGLAALENDALADIVQKELEESEGLKRRETAGYIAFMELAKRSGWNVD